MTNLVTGSVLLTHDVGLHARPSVKLTKLAQGHLDLHSSRSQVDMDWLADRARELGGPASLDSLVRQANTALEVLRAAQGARVALADAVAQRACDIALSVLEGDTAVEVLVVDRRGRLEGRAGGW